MFTIKIINNMTKQEILNIDNLLIAEEVNGKFIHLHAKDGYYITNYKQGDEEYYGSVCIYFPIMEEYEDYYTLTEVEHLKLLKEYDNNL